MESKYTIDVFISYAHIDNITFVKGDDGWVTSFHAALQTRLSQVLGEPVKIWRDAEQLQGNDMFADKIVNQFGHTAIMISIITPRYVKSEWCNKEINEFVRVANTIHSIRIKDKLRIFKVIKTPVALELQPEAIRHTLGYDFFIKNPVTKLDTELTLESENLNKYKDVLDVLVWDIKVVLELLRKAEEETARLGNRTPEEIAADITADTRLKEDARVAEDARMLEISRLQNEENARLEKEEIRKEKQRIKKEEQTRRNEEERKKAQKESIRIKKEEGELRRVEEAKKKLTVQSGNSFSTVIKYSIGVLLFIGGLIYLFRKDPQPEAETKRPTSIPMWMLIAKPQDKYRITNALSLVNNIHNNMPPGSRNYRDNEAMRGVFSKSKLAMDNADFINYTKARSITVNNKGIMYDPAVKCKIEKRGYNYYFEVSEGIIRKSGILYFKDSSTYVYLGGSTIGSRATVKYNADGGEAGLLFRLVPDKLLLLIPSETTYTLMEFEK